MEQAGLVCTSLELKDEGLVAEEGVGGGSCASQVKRKQILTAKGGKLENERSLGLYHAHR